MTSIGFVTMLQREIDAGGRAEGEERRGKLLANGNAKSGGGAGKGGKWCCHGNRRPWQTSNQHFPSIDATPKSLSVLS